MSSQKTGSDKDKLIGFARIESFHPYKTFLFFGLVGSAVLFLTIILLFAVKHSANSPLLDFKMPKLFFLSTVVLLFSSYSLSGTLHFFKTDDIRSLSFALFSALGLSLVFSGLQVACWYQLYKSGFFITTETGVSFLYLITGMHMLHVFIGIIFLLTCIRPVFYASGDMVKALVFFSDKYQRTKIELLNIYWHYIDFLWLSLFFMFLFVL